MGFRFAVQLIVSQLLRPFVRDETREARLPPSRERREATGGDPHFSGPAGTPTIYFRFDFCAGVDAPRFSVG